MLDNLQNQIAAFFSGLKGQSGQRPTETVAAYVETNRVYLCSATNGNVNCSSMTALINPAKSIEPQLINTLSSLRKQFEPLRPIQLILTLPCDTPTLSKGYLHKAATQLNCVLYTFDFRTCCAMGIGLDISSCSKSLVVIVTDRTFHVFITFLDGLFYQTDKSIGPDDSMSDAVATEVLNLKKRVSSDLPPRIRRNLFSTTEEFNQVLEGWRKPLNGNIHVVFTSRKQMEFKVSIIDHNVITYDNFDEIVNAGLSKIATVMNNEKV